ncbi:MAG TPA: hypothetical protein DCM28_01100 [Phycisphaerales bacterium]|nr:hypothetical protein [Phycisphaerales bacterium]HCD32126.1 hypothetical protein [Phycisphaerales bacterium]|tara:strand:- start:9127 stop:9465 length:339 start_codon:yes stop_codon:yes gene_type:complete
MKYLIKRHILLYAVALTFLFELLTVILRFGFAMESTRDTASTIGLMTMGLRVHHGYIGLIMIAAAVFIRPQHMLAKWVFIAGLALFASDMIHHFLVLWPATGSPQFHLVYPQ